MKKFRQFMAMLLPLAIPVILFAQDDTEKTGLGNTMRSNGRIYVVIAVILTILTGLIIYLVRLDRKIGKLEKETT
jgi:hypothetical protein